MLHDRVHEQTPITRQERSIFASHNLEQLPIISVFGVGDIKSEQTKIAREASQMSISNKSCNVNRLQSFLRALRARILNRENLYFCVA